MIPKKIHYCWFGGEKLPNSVKKNIESWKKYCPDYEIIQWNESNFDINSNKFVREAYEAKAWAFVSDYIRLKVVYDIGGIYLDTDVEIIKNLDFLLNNESYFCVQQFGKYINTGLGFGAEKNAEIVGKMLSEYDDVEFNYDEKLNISCPILNTKAAEKLGFAYSDNVHEYSWGTVYPPQYADPYAPGTSESLMCADTFSIHHYSASWTSVSNRIKLRLYNLLGMERINFIKKLIKK